MTSLEVDLEREKTEKLAQVAARGLRVAHQLGQDDPAEVRTFLDHYFRHVDPGDVEERGVEDLLGLVESHYRVALERPAEQPTVVVRAPSSRTDAWTAGGATVVQIVTDDRPFLVDSVTTEVLRQGWSIREVFHPQFLVRRNSAGHLEEILAFSEAESIPNVTQESWMHLEVLPPARPEAPERLVPDLEQGLREVLRLVRDSVDDWDQMITQAREIADGLQGPEVPTERRPEAESARELLLWLTGNHFTFLGYREFHLNGDRFEPVAGSGLGILRGEDDRPGAFQALPQPGTRPWLMIITKDNERSRVHRPAYLDYIGIRSFDAAGRVVAERRFLGLFSSSAYTESVRGIPLVRQKAEAVLQRSGYQPDSHGGKAIMDALETYPRDELFQASVSQLASAVERIAHLKERRQVRLFVRPDPYGRYLSCLVYLPRDRYTTAVRNRMQTVLLTQAGGATIDYSARVSESVLARLHFVVRMPPGQPLAEIDVRALERELTLATRSWNDEFADQLGDSDEDDRLATLVGGLPEGYKEDYSPKQAVQDLTALLALTDDENMSLALYVPDRATDEADLRLKIMRRDASLSLSRILPHLTLLGVDVIDERPYEVALPAGDHAYVYDFGLTVAGGADAVAHHWSIPARQRFMDAFTASYLGRSESDGFNALVMTADLDWRQVSVLRAIGRYLRQVGVGYSQTYLAQALTANVDLTRNLVGLFGTKFDPAIDVSADTRAERVRSVVGQIEAGLADVVSLDHDRIIRSYLAVVAACVRTNYFASGRRAIALKLLPRQIPDLPEPRPAFEIFVYSPAVEGVHLRFGSVARGGLRWSDRAEDFRTEILGLVKAQMVKNAVIVPVGAKGGFYGKQLPDPSEDRDAWLAQGQDCYRTFITSLLDVTDNLLDGQVVPPPEVIRYDGDDPYLVVAADKGTATFSDIANAISVSAGFWLGDAFASGGSAGYDHKAMGITARGAWESVRRHFREQGIDPQAQDFTCVGIGDMSGDVFGNGMLLSHHIELVAAFDHRHVFVDPHPDPERSWAERARLFALPRSSWADYDASLISTGGGIFPRTQKSVPITPQMREALGIDDSVTALSPAELIRAALQAPVDLLWNGGIGTYVKAAGESNAQVGDKANDALRINGGQIRAHCVGEGGNLGLTQLGRIEYAMHGGRINTDFIDNSAGVDTSDHEVNFKILLSAEVAAGRLSEADRDAFLASMTDDVARSVLAHNDEQNLALANSVFQAPAMARVHQDWITRLVDQGQLDREIEFLPEDEELTRRRGQQSGLTSPELATLLAYTKIVLENAVLESTLPEDPYLTGRLIDYFPPAMQERYADRMAEHRLRREIISTVVVNDFVNTAGITCFHRLTQETGAGAPDLIRAHIAARTIFGVEALEEDIRALDHRVAADEQTRLRLEVRTLVERSTRWLVNNRRRPVDIGSAVADYAAGVQAVMADLPDILTDRDLAVLVERQEAATDVGVPVALATAIGGLPAAYAALSIVATATRDGDDSRAVARVHFTLGQQLGLDRLLNRVVELPRDDRWQTMARAALRDDVHAVHARLTSEVLAGRGDGDPSALELVSAWERRTPQVQDSIQTLRSICADAADLARVSVGLRVVRGLLAGA